MKHWLKVGLQIQCLIQTFFGYAIFFYIYVKVKYWENSISRFRSFSANLLNEKTVYAPIANQDLKKIIHKNRFL